MFESCNILKIFCHHDFSYTRWMIYSSDNFLYGFFKITYQVYMILIDRSTHCRCSVKKSVLRNLANFTGKPLCWILFWRPLGRQLYQKKTPTELFAEFLRTPILQNICKWLFLDRLFYEPTYVSFTHFWSMFLFYTTWKQQKMKDFLVVWLGMKCEHWLEIGQDNVIWWAFNPLQPGFAFLYLLLL